MNQFLCVVYVLFHLTLNTVAVLIRRCLLPISLSMRSNFQNMQFENKTVPNDSIDIISNTIIFSTLIAIQFEKVECVFILISHVLPASELILHIKGWFGIPFQIQHRWMFMCRFYSGFFLFSCCCHTYWRTPTKYQENTQPPESNQWINYYKCLTSDWCCNENVIFIVMFLFFTISSIPSVWMACVRHKTWPLISIIFPIHIIYISIWFLNRFTLLHTFFFLFETQKRPMCNISALPETKKNTH